MRARDKIIRYGSPQVWRPVGTRLVAASGFFNGPHVGHLRMLEEARRLGGRLVVVVNNDRQVIVKGSVSYMSEHERLELVAGFEAVDFVVLSADVDRSVNKTLEWLRPQVFANGGDVTEDNFNEAEVCRRLGITPVFGVGGYHKIQSSSSLIANSVKIPTSQPVGSVSIPLSP